MFEDESRALPADAVAVTGLAGRFPGAGDTGVFWSNLLEGVESLTRLEENDYFRSGLPRSVWVDPAHRKSAFLLEGIDCFDADFFGITPGDAAQMDPQHRLFLECAWQCLEQAGLDPARDGSGVGVFAGCYRNTYALTRREAESPLMAQHGWSDMIGSDPDYLATRVAYHLNLRGPAVTVQCACSSGLAAVHFAAQALRAGECQAALAGAVTLMVPPEAGYLYKEGGIGSEDGHTRCFDAAASGTVFSSAVAAVLLKPLALARRDGNAVHAVLRGSAINNDGGPKRAFTAPDPDGQEAVLRAAWKAAGIDPRTATYVEAHATGTQKGDRAEWEALQRVYGGCRLPGDGALCWVGGCKANIGHTGTVSGLAGFIKVVQMLRHGWIPPQILFQELHPELQREGSRLGFEREGRPWAKPAEFPRRAGVTALGFGGTNVHAVLEEAPPDVRKTQWTGPVLLPLSARTAEGLRRRREDLALWFEQFPETPLSDVSFTLRMGRHPFLQRTFVVADNAESACALLRGADLEAGEQAEAAIRTIWLFPGHGAEYPRMGEGLYRRFPVFRDTFDSCAAAFLQYGGPDVKALLYSPRSMGAASGSLRETIEIQPVLFALELSLSRLWESFGLRPDAVLGYSVGEYAAATAAGVMDLETAVRLIAARARGGQDTAEGGMLAVALPEAEIQRQMPPGLSLAAVAAVDHVILAGSPSAVAEGARVFEAGGVASRALRVTRGFHSPLMEPMLADFRSEVEQADLKRPNRPVLSGRLGTLCEGSELTDPEYWVRELIEPIRFADAVKAAEPTAATVFLECGPGGGLGNLARRHPAASAAGAWTVASLPRPADGLRAIEKDARFEAAAFLRALGTLWSRGALLEWRSIDSLADARRIPLPGYPFESKRHWIEMPARAGGKSVARKDRPLELLECNVALEECESEGAEEMPLRTNLVRTDFGGPLQFQLAELLAETLGESPSGPEDNFFDLGGNSLLAVQFVSRVRDALRIETPVSAFLREPTVGAFATAVEAALCGKAGAAATAGGTAPAAGLSEGQHCDGVRLAVFPRTAARTSPGVMGIVAAAKPAPLTFSVFFFEGEAEADASQAPYALLLEAAQFADAQGFEAVWTPERHFNAFGGLYPNPALMGAALATMTRRIRIRGGSVIAPLHHPARIAEDWSTLDNLSRGRVDLCFAAGFHPNDFVFAPHSYRERGLETLRVLEEVQRLWRGGLIEAADGSGRPLGKPVYPRPVQAELPFWLAAIRHSNTFVEAGRRGGNVLTALLRLSPAELKQRIGLYRQERAQAGYRPETGRVTLMIHAFAGESEDAVKNIVSGPMEAYVRSHLEFLRPLSGEGGRVSEADAEDLMRFAVERFCRDSALLGTVDECVARSAALAEAGVDEIACLLDFGVSADAVMASLRLLVEVRDRTVRELGEARRLRGDG